ncbi:MAG: beta-propeller fold lactonase family protein [Deltaproteobacteria bacterium]|nr:beta-propeller fold lactonase family protein [Deltaproteobacteria bacterium]
MSKSKFFANLNGVASPIFLFIVSFLFISGIFTFMPQYVGSAYALLTPRLTRNIPVGSFPFGVAFSPNGNYALVSNSDNDTVSVVSMATKGTVASIKVGSHPTGVAIAPSLTFAYVCNTASGNVSLLNMSTLTKSLNIRTGGSPVNVVFSPDSRYAFVSNIHNNEVDVINTMQNTVIKRIRVGKKPQGIAVSPDGKIIIVANAGGSSVSIINASTLSVIRNIHTGKNPTSVAFSPDSSPVRYIYVSSGKENKIYVYDEKNFALVKKFKTLSDPSSLGLTQDGMMLFVVNYQNMALSIYNAVHFNRIKTISLPAGPINVAVSPDGSVALVTVTSASSAAFIRIKRTTASYASIAPASPVTVGTAATAVTSPVQASSAEPTAPYGYSPAYVPPSNYVAQPFGKVATVYTGKGPTAAAVTPDGRYLYVINTQDATLSVIDIAKAEVVKTVKVGSYPSAVRISPDGHYCFVVNSGTDTVTIISTGNYY